MRQASREEQQAWRLCGEGGSARLLQVENLGRCDRGKRCLEGMLR